MNLRNKLVLSFLLLSVLPLSAIVVYGYVTSSRALWAAALEESAALAANLSDRMESVEEDLSDSVKGLSVLPFESLLVAGAEGAGGSAVSAAEYELLMRDVAPFVDTLEFVPAAPSAPPAPPAPDPRPEPVSREPIVIDLETLGEMARKAAQRAEERAARAGRPMPDEETVRAAEEIAVLGAQLGVQFGVEVAQKVQAGFEAAGVFGGEPPALAAPAVAEAMGAERVHAARVHAVHDREKAKLLREAYECSVQEAGRKVGELRARVEAKRVLGAVLSGADREQGEIPFAVDSEGNLYAASDDDRVELERLGVVRPGDLAGTLPKDWVVVKADYPQSDLAFGIARPLRESMRELERTAGRTLAFGLGLVSLALVGVVPLSRRITRDLGELTKGAERLAAGELDVEVPVRSEDEVGRLATTFNRMALDLKDNREKLVETELRQRLLATENERKTLELEEARRFQLSLLPKELPRHPGLDVAVFMRTATEVGGDYYDFLTGADGSLTVAVGDATGHGAKAGTMVTVLKSLFVAKAEGQELEDFLAEAAASVRRMDLGRMAMALVLARIEGRRLVVSSAGMPPLLICRGGGGVEEVTLPGLPLGGMAQPSYRRFETSLEERDLVLLMSDGLPELLNADGEPFGYARVRAALGDCAGRSPQEVLDSLAAAAEAWTGGNTPGDDVTFVALEVV